MKLRPLFQCILVIVAVTVLSLLYFFYPALPGGFYPKCPFNQFTGLYCPGCGSQRAASALLHGHLGTALSYNMLFVLSLPIIGYSAFVFAWNTFSHVKLRQTILYSPFFIRSLLVFVLAYWILRNLPCFVCRWLAP